MNSFSPDEQQDRQLGRRLTARRNDRRPSSHDPADHAVHDAEQIVGEAWVEVLLWHRHQARAASHIATMHCEDAQRRLSAMLLGRAPTGISAAHADLEAALAAARQAVRTYEQAHQGLVGQLESSAFCDGAPTSSPAPVASHFGTAAYWSAAPAARQSARTTPEHKRHPLRTRFWSQASLRSCCDFGVVHGTLYVIRCAFSGPVLGIIGRKQAIDIDAGRRLTRPCSSHVILRR
jgi:hypothetical protein